MHCERCTYHLEGLPPGSDGRVKCPECGLSQYRRRFLPPWPSALAVVALACGPTILLALASLALRLWISTFTGFFIVLAAMIGLVLPPIASLIPEKSSLRRHQLSPLGLAAAVTLGGWFVNATAVALVTAIR